MITIRSMAKVSACPGCGSPSERVHSRYRRWLADLPIAGRPVHLIVLARRFYCSAVLCGRWIFTECFDADVLAPWARRTARLEYIVHHLGLALGDGELHQDIARRFLWTLNRMLPRKVVRKDGYATDARWSLPDG
jgi:transposase IS204/IS1001/IS1096/IS1165 family protein